MNKEQYDFKNINKEYLERECFDEYEDGNEDNIMHDDGFMHIELKSGKRYSFDIGQNEISNSQYNKEANIILKEANISGSKISGQNI